MLNTLLYILLFLGGIHAGFLLVWSFGTKAYSNEKPTPLVCENSYVGFLAGTIFRCENSEAVCFKTYEGISCIKK